jgi:hypothetical protein
LTSLPFIKSPPFDVVHDPVCVLVALSPVFFRNRHIADEGRRELVEGYAEVLVVAEAARFLVADVIFSVLEAYLHVQRYLKGDRLALVEYLGEHQMAAERRRRLA